MRVQIQQQNYYYLMIKVQYNREIHIVKTEESIQGFKRAVKNVFKALPNQFHFTYKDQDNDCIVVDCQNDFKVVLEKQLTEGKKRLKLQVIQSLQANVEIEQGIQFLGDGESSVEILLERHQNEQYSINTDENCENTELFQSIEYAKEDQSFLISEEALENKEIKQAKAAQEQIHNTFIREQVSLYIQSMLSNIQDKIEKEEQQKNRLRVRDGIEITGMIERSLSRLLPKFMRRVSEQTIKTVKKLISQQIA